MCRTSLSSIRMWLNKLHLHQQVHKVNTVILNNKSLSNYSNSSILTITTLMFKDPLPIYYHLKTTLTLEMVTILNLKTITENSLMLILETFFVSMISKSNQMKSNKSRFRRLNRENSILNLIPLLLNNNRTLIKTWISWLTIAWYKDNINFSNNKWWLIHNTKC